MKTATLLERKPKPHKPKPLGVLAARESVGPSSPPEPSPPPASGEFALGSPDGQAPATLEQVRTAHIERMLEFCGGNRVRAAALLGIGRTSLYRFLKRQSRKKEASA